jgi:hypothetical protein
LEEIREAKCQRLYDEARLAQIETQLVDAMFSVYHNANEISNNLFLPDEVRFAGGGHVRRGMLEKKLGEIITSAGGLVEPQFSYRLTPAGLRVETSHYTLFRIGEIALTISSVTREDMPPKFARFRKDLSEGLIPRAMIPFAFVEEDVPPPPPDAAAWFMLKHGKEPFDSTIPQFTHIAALDQNGSVAWDRNLYETQVERVEYWVGQRENTITDPASLLTLKAYIRALRMRGA